MSILTDANDRGKVPGVSGLLGSLNRPAVTVGMSDVGNELLLQVAVSHAQEHLSQRGRSRQHSLGLRCLREGRLVSTQSSRCQRSPSLAPLNLAYRAVEPVVSRGKEALTVPSDSTQLTGMQSSLARGQQPMHTPVNKQLLDCCDAHI